MKSFGMLLVAVMGCAVYAAPDQSPAPNYVFNGSFELPDTNPNGWNAVKQQGWIGWENVPQGANAAEKQLYTQLKNNVQRQIVPSGAAGKVALKFTSKSVKGAEKLKNIQSKIRQIVKIPTTTQPQTVLTLTLKSRGAANSVFYAMLNAKKVDAAGKKSSAGQFRSWKIAPTQDWQTFQQYYVVSAGCNSIELDLMLEGIGEMIVDDIAIRPNK